MKIRTGFVANSSVSSFIIETTRTRYDRDVKKAIVETLVTDSQIQDLLDFGFKKTHLHDADQATQSWFSNHEYPDGKDASNYAITVVCNEDEVSHFLLTNGIPFKASCHYSHRTEIYDGKRYAIIPNPGKVAEMHGIDFFNSGKSYNGTILEGDDLKSYIKGED